MPAPEHYRDGTCGECEHFDFASGICFLHDFDPDAYAVCDDFKSVTDDIANVKGAGLSWKHV